MQTTPSHTLNGLNLEQMVATIDALKQDPTLARFEFRARNQWESGGVNHSTIRDF